MPDGQDVSEEYVDVLEATRSLLSEVRERNTEARAVDQAEGEPFGEASYRDVVDSDKVADRVGWSRLDVEKALKHLVECDRVTATFFTDKPAEVTEA
jgi:hypothetical protein